MRKAAEFTADAQTLSISYPHTAAILQQIADDYRLQMTIEEKETVIACILNFEQIICFSQEAIKMGSELVRMQKPLISAGS